MFEWAQLKSEIGAEESSGYARLVPVCSESSIGFEPVSCGAARFGIGATSWSASHKHQKHLVGALRRRKTPVRGGGEYGTGAISFKTDTVKVMTIRNAKGLEFDHLVAFRFERGDSPGKGKNRREMGVYWRMQHTLVTRARKSVSYFANATATDRYITFMLTKNVDPEFINETTDTLPPLVVD